MALLKLLLMIASLVLQISGVFNGEVTVMCNGVVTFIEADAPWQQDFGIALFYFLLLFLIHSVLELPKMLCLYKNHVKEFWLQLFVVGSFVFHWITGSFFDEEGVAMSNLMLALLLNLLESLSSNMYCGKYILLATAVLKTLMKTTLPVVLLILALAANGLALRQKEITSSNVEILAG